MDMGLFRFVNKSEALFCREIIDGMTPIAKIVGIPEGMDRDQVKALITKSRYAKLGINFNGQIGSYSLLTPPNWPSQVKFDAVINYLQLGAVAA